MIKVVVNTNNEGYPLNSHILSFMSQIKAQSGLSIVVAFFEKGPTKDPEYISELRKTILQQRMFYEGLEGFVKVVDARSKVYKQMLIIDMALKSCSNPSG